MKGDFIMKKLLITEDLHEKVVAQSLVQTEKEEFSASDDPEVQVFSYEPQMRYQVYIPELYMTVNGEKVFSKIRALSHTIYRNGNYMGTYRCIRDLNIPELGLDGECPLCNGVADSWEYYKMKHEMKCVEKGLNSEDRSNEDVSLLAKDLIRMREIQEPKAYLYFPIVVFETTKDNKVLLENGKPKYQIYIYTISEYSFNSIWEVQMSNSGVESLAGQFLVLSYIYDTKGKQPNKRDAGNNLQLTFRNIPESLKPFIDEINNDAKRFTVAKISNALVSLALYDKKELESIKNKALATYYQIRAKEEQKLITGGTQQKSLPSVEDVISSFGKETII